MTSQKDKNLFTSNDVTISDIGFKNKLKSHHLYFSLINQIAELITKIPEFQNYVVKQN